MRTWLILLLWVGYASVQGQDTRSAEVLRAQQALRIANEVQRFDRLIDLADAFTLADQFDSARVVADRALAAATNNSEQAHAQLAIARVLNEQGDQPGAQERARQAVLLARTAGDTSLWIEADGILMVADMDLDRFEQARVRAVDMLPVARATHDSTGLSRILSTLSNIHYLAHRFDSARWYSALAVAAVPQADARNRFVLLMNQVDLFVEEAQYDSALARSNAMRDEALRWDGEIRVQYFNQRGYTLFNAGRYREAIMEFQRSDSVNEAGPRKLDMRIENTGFLAESHAALGDSAGAYMLMRDLEVLKDSFNRKAGSERMLRLEKQFETRIKDDEIQRLDAENRQKAERIQAKNIQLYGSLALALLAVGAIALIGRNLRQKRRHAAVLETLNNELKDQKGRIEGINRLLQLKVLRTQMNPHFMYNCLHAIGNLVRKGENAAASAYLDGFARLLRMVLDHSVKDRVPISAELDFLRQYLKLESLRFEDGLQYLVEAEKDLLDEDVEVPALVIQPFVENAIWHGLAPKSGDRRVSVRFAEVEGKLMCTVEDNGVGREAAPKRAHTDGSASMGLQLTNERLQLLTYKLENAVRVQFNDLRANGLAMGTRVEVVLGRSPNLRT